MRQAAATSIGLGLPNMALALVPGHAGVQSNEELHRNILEVTAAQVIDKLTRESAQSAIETEPGACDIVFSGSFDLDRHRRKELDRLTVADVNKSLEWQINFDPGRISDISVLWIQNRGGSRMHAQWISRIAMLVLSIAGFGLAAGDACAQRYPNKPVTLIVPYGPGTGIDVVGRVIAQKVSETWTYPIVVVNRPGATGGIGLEMTAKALPDGYTVVMASNSQILNQFVSKARYDMVKEFAPVSLTGSQRMLLAVTNSSPAKSVDELVALAKFRPGKLSYAGTPGSTFHFMGEMLKSARGIEIVMIPYKSSTDAVADLVAGRVEILFTAMPTALPLVKAGKIRVLGVSGEKRTTWLPDVPTMAEAGIPTLDVNSTLYILAPVATPKTIVNALNSEIVKALGTEEVRDRLAGAGFEPKGGTPEELGALIKSEVTRWGKIVKDSGFRLD